MSNFTLIENANVLDVMAGALTPNQRVVIEGKKIAHIEPMSAERTAPADATVINANGKTVMPGLIDCHVHVMAWTANLSQLKRGSPNYNVLRATGVMRDMLMRGFTTLRDACGADFGLQDAVNEDLIPAPRLFICGRSLSQTGGHSDSRQRGEVDLTTMTDPVAFGRIVDGVDAVRQACREEIRRGANHIKLMLGGGVSSPTDRLTNDQYSLDEIRAAVEEAAMADLYVMAHTYTARTVNRAIQCGVHSLEHCNLIDESSIELFVKHGAWMVPTLVTYEALAAEGVKAGLPKDVEHKIYLVLDKGLGALEMAYKAGVKLAYGTDLLGDMHRHQLREFIIRAQVQPNIEIIRAATSYAADLLRAKGQLGVLAPGAWADLLIVDGNPLADITCLANPDRYLKLIMKGGKVYKEG